MNGESCGVLEHCEVMDENCRQNGCSSPKSLVLTIEFPESHGVIGIPP